MASSKHPVDDAPYSTEELASIRELLVKRRHDLIAAQQAHAVELADEQSRDPAAEEEEAAAHQHTQFVTARVREGIHREVTQIDFALERLDAGEYGLCDECGEPIAIERLRVLPYTRMCAVDAAAEEREKVAHSQGRSLTL